MEMEKAERLYRNVLSVSSVISMQDSIDSIFFSHWILDYDIWDLLWCLLRFQFAIAHATCSSGNLMWCAYNVNIINIWLVLTLVCGGHFYWLCYVKYSDLEESIGSGMWFQQGGLMCYTVSDRTELLKKKLLVFPPLLERFSFNIVSPKIFYSF